MVTTYKIKNIETQDEISKVTSMNSSSVEQNEYLKQAIDSGVIRLEDCFILVHNKEIVARAVIMNNYLANCRCRYKKLPNEK